MALLLVALYGCGAPESMDELREAGQQALDDGKYAEARGYFRQAMKLDNKDRDLLVSCAEACRQDYMYDSALYFLKRADLMHPGDIEVNREIRQLAIALGDWQNAIAAIRVLEKANAAGDDYHTVLADLYTRNGQPGPAFFHARRALMTSPDNPAFYVQTAAWAAQYDSVGIGIEILDQAIAKFGPQDQFVVNKAMYLAFVGESRKAESLLRGVVKKSSSPNPTMQLNLANILATQPERSKKEEALEIYAEIRDILAGAYPIDSLSQVVKTELGLQ